VWRGLRIAAHSRKDEEALLVETVRVADPIHSRIGAGERGQVKAGCGCDFHKEVMKSKVDIWNAPDFKRGKRRMTEGKEGLE